MGVCDSTWLTFKSPNLHTLAKIIQVANFTCTIILFELDSQAIQGRVFDVYITCLGDLKKSYLYLLLSLLFMTMRNAFE